MRNSFLFAIGGLGLAAPCGLPDVATGKRPNEDSVAYGVNLNHDDLTVTDALAFPTSRDQCKNGGWRTFRVFNTQGDCVSFVATGGKNPPATNTKP